MIKTKVELLNEIANKLGDTNADEMITESQALQNILDYIGGGSGGGGVVIGFRKTTSPVELDHTYGEIESLLNEGKFVMLYYEMDGSKVYRPLTTFDNNNGSYSIYFAEAGYYFLSSDDPDTYPTEDMD